jgi:hypothetical protein
MGIGRSKSKLYINQRKKTCNDFLSPEKKHVTDFVSLDTKTCISQYLQSQQFYENGYFAIIWGYRIARGLLTLVKGKAIPVTGREGP